MTPSRRRRLVGWSLLAWLLVAGAVWNGFFDILITRGEKQYLLSQARHELGIGPRVTIDGIMSRTIVDARRIATIWATLVFASGMITTIIVLHLRGEAIPRNA
jgi:hypothetical protein